VSFTNSLQPLISANNQILENGAGVALGDADGDGRCDIFLCGSERPSALYRNAGNWKFEDITAAAGAGLDCRGQFTTGAALADVDGDGDLDLLVNGIGVGTRLFLNDGRGHFTEDNQSGLTRTYAATSLALADLDGDGDLDLYVCNYRTSSARDDPNAPRPTARRVGNQILVSPADRFTGFARSDGTIEVTEKGEPDILYLNNGKGKFQSVSWTGGAFRDENGQALRAPPEDWALSVMLRDLNGDGAPDIYVCNDFWHARDRLWLNDGRGQFRAISPIAWRSMPASSMAMDVADINRDGYDDFLVVEMLSPDHQRRQRQRATVAKTEWNRPLSNPNYTPEISRNTLHLARGDGTFAEVAQLAGLAATDWSWAVAFLDVDLDGWEDLLIATGNNHDQMNADMAQALAGPPGRPRALREYQPLLLPNLAFRNRGDLTFEERGAAWGFDGVGISQGMALGDLDNDGDLDVVVNNLNREAWLYRNNSTASRLAVRLRGLSPNTQGIGARIQVAGGPVAQSQSLAAGGRYLSSDQPMRVFAAGSSPRELTMLVQWPGGQTSSIQRVTANHLYEVSQPARPSATPIAPQTSSAPSPTHFLDRSELVQATHRDEPFDDFARQPLLEWRLSQAGPGVTWFDIDGDGWDELIVGSGRGGTLAVFHNDGRGKFQRLHNPALDETISQDQTSVLGWNAPGSTSKLLAGSTSYEQPVPSGAFVREYTQQSTAVTNWLATTNAMSVGPLALADFDGDGDLDLFVGGRVVPGRYPEPAGAEILVNDNGQFKRPSSTNVFAAVGMISGVVCSDLDGDGAPDLVLACEWGPLKIFLNQRGTFTEATSRLGLDGFNGFWNGVAAGDFDGDGRMDLVASNWGRNTRYQPFLQRPWRLYYGDFDGNGALDLVEAYFAPSMGKWVPWYTRDTLGNAMPNLRARFPSFQEFARASLEDVLGERRSVARFVQVEKLDSTVFLNRGARFEAHSLPQEAQVAPAFGVAVADFDGDGKEDIALAQNLFATTIETSRFDAGRGLWLRGDGTGNFQAVPGQVSGILLYGEQRGLAVSDYDGDGRVDLAVGQNSGPMRLLRNQGARPGVRLRLQGTAGNPSAVGAQLRLKYGDRFGPAREIHNGAGYWSQDSFVQVMAMPEPPTHVWVRWPGGRVTTTAFPAGAQELALDESGNVKKFR
jgi:hypothetical protein